MQNILELLTLIAVAAVLARSAVRTWHAETRAIKWGGAGLLGGLSAAAVSVAALMSLGMIEQHRRSAPVPDIRVASTPEMLARGKGIADGLCGACHSHTGTLTGGYDVAVELQFPIGSFVAANLTPAGALQHRSDGEQEKNKSQTAIRVSTNVGVTHWCEVAAIAEAKTSMCRFPASASICILCAVPIFPHCDAN